MAGRPSPRVVHVTSAHPAHDHRITEKECVSLAEAGYDVWLLVPHARRESIWGIPIEPVPRPASRVQRMTRTMLALVRAARRLDGDVYHLHDPELLPLGLWLKASGRRVVYDVHEDLPGVIRHRHWIRPWLRGLVAAAADAFELFAARVVDVVVAATPRIARRFPRAETRVVRNYPRLERFGAVRGRPYAERGAVVVYVGGLARERGLLEMVRAMELVPAALGARLVLGGDFVPPSLEGEARGTPGWERLEYRGWLSREEVVDLLGEARVGLVMVHDVPNFIEGNPVKLFEYMAAGLPVVASHFPLWRAIVEESGCGLVADPHRPETVADAVSWLLRHPAEAEAMGRRGRQAVLDRYNWAPEAAELVRVYRELLAPL